MSADFTNTERIFAAYRLALCATGIRGQPVVVATQEKMYIAIVTPHRQQ
jgi:hypothetical protein